MDRNTLLAFFLISLVLIFTPKYIELVSGESRTEERSFIKNESETDTLETNPNSSLKDLDFYSSNKFVDKIENPKKNTFKISIWLEQIMCPI